MNFSNEQMTKTVEQLFDIRMKTRSIDTDITTPKKSRVFYRINQDKLNKYRHENQLLHNDANNNTSMLINKIIHRKTIGTQTTSSEPLHSSSTNSTDTSSAVSQGRE